MVLDRCVDNFFAETEQAAFCTNNIVPGVDFSNDPLLQGRNFSYLDTQLKRLGGPNFTQIPINAPKCPFATLQQDGHMAIINPKNRVNYQPTLGLTKKPAPARILTAVFILTSPKKKAAKFAFVPNHSRITTVRRANFTLARPRWSRIISLTHLHSS